MLTTKKKTHKNLFFRVLLAFVMWLEERAGDFFLDKWIFIKSEVREKCIKILKKERIKKTIFRTIKNWNSGLKKKSKKSSLDNNKKIKQNSAKTFVSINQRTSCWFSHREIYLIFTWIDYFTRIFSYSSINVTFWIYTSLIDSKIKVMYIPCIIFIL